LSLDEEIDLRGSLRVAQEPALTALSVLDRHQFRQLRPGENDKDFQFKGAGLVVICQEVKATERGQPDFRILTATDADDALVTAKRLISQRARRGTYVFAMLASLLPQQRTQALAELAEMCSEGI
jgi:hypothetical protein